MKTHARATLLSVMLSSIGLTASAQDTTAGGAGLTVTPQGFGAITVRENQRRFEGSLTFRPRDYFRITARVGAPLDADSRTAGLLTPAGGLVSGFTAGLELSYDGTAVSFDRWTRSTLNQVCAETTLEQTRHAATQLAASAQSVLPQLGNPAVVGAQLVERLRDAMSALASDPGNLAKIGSASAAANAFQAQATGIVGGVPSMLVELVAEVGRFVAGAHTICGQRGVASAYSRQERLGIAPGRVEPLVTVGVSLAGGYDRRSAYVGALPTPTANGTLPRAPEHDDWRFEAGVVSRIYIGERNVFSVRAGITAEQLVKPSTTQLCVPTMAGAADSPLRCSQVSTLAAAPASRSSSFFRVAYAHLFGNVVDGALPGFELRAAGEAWGTDDQNLVFGASAFVMPSVGNTLTRFGLGLDVTVPLAGEDRTARAVPFVLVGVTP